MRPYILAETNWKTVKDEQYQLVVLPWGATEAHNYHLPYSTDNVEAAEIAAGAARIAWEKGARLTVLPGIPFGVNTGQFDVQLDINLNPSTQFAILNDVIETLNRQGIYKLVILNSHGGNDFRQMLRELGLKYPKMFLSEVNWYKVKETKDIFEDLGEHAGEVETSLMLYLKPEWVLPLSEAGDGTAKKYRFNAMGEGIVPDEYARSDHPLARKLRQQIDRRRGCQRQNGDGVLGNTATGLDADGSTIQQRAGRDRRAVARRQPGHRFA